MMSPAEPTVHVVDDDEDVRDALRWLIESIRVPVRTYESAERFLDHYDPVQPGCMLLDVRMPGMGGMGLLEQLNQRGSPLPVIMLTGHGEVPLAVRAMKAGAFDFIEKPYTDQDLLGQVRKALDKSVSTHSEDAERARVLACLAELTPRERQILDRLVNGEVNKTISAAIGISDRTVETHRAHIMAKMQARSFADLVRLTLLARSARAKQ